MNMQQQGYGTVAGPEYEEQLFKDKFGEMAFAALSAKFAEIMDKVITFKVINIDAEEGKGVGVFIINMNDNPLYIPVILVDSRLKPIEILYYKELNMFLPLDLPWLDEITKMSLSEMGEGADIPPMVPRDVDVSNIVVPPQVNIGRYGYASWDEDIDNMMKAASVQEELSNTDLFLKTLEVAPRVALDGIKLAFEQQPKLLNILAGNYGMGKVIDAMNSGYANACSVEKTATVTPGKVTVVTKTASPKELQDVFGPDKATAFQLIHRDGFAVKDTRNHIEKVAVKLEKPTFLASPGPKAAWCKLYFVDGKPGNYLTIPFPKDGCGSSDVYCVSDRSEAHRAPTPYLVISEDGTEVWKTDDVLGEPLVNPQDSVGSSKVFKLVTGDDKGTTPSVGSYGVFVNVTGDNNIECTGLITVERVVTDGNITKYCTDYQGTYIVDQDPSRKHIQQVSQGGLYYLPKDTKFIEALKVKDTEKSWKETEEYNRIRKNSVIKDPKVLLRWLNNLMQDSGVEQPQVKSAGIDQFWLAGIDHPVDKTVALEKIATQHSLSVTDASCILDNACSLGKADIYIVNANGFGPMKEALTKFAAVPQEEGPQAYQSTPGQQEGLPPAGSAPMAPSPGMELPPGESMDPMAMEGMGAMQVPAVSPTDLAIGEAVQGLQQQIDMQQQDTEAQMAQLEQQAAIQTQANQQLVQTLQGIQERSGQIMQATGGMIPPQAMESPAVAAGELAPLPPIEEEPPPMPIMDQEVTSPEIVAQQINPSMVEQAQEFNDAGVFDTASISMLASAPVLQDIVSTYVPNLEKAIDNLGRILVTLWLKESETKENIGDEAFASLEDKLRTVFKGLGDVVLSLSHNSVNSPKEISNAKMMMQG